MFRFSTRWYRTLAGIFNIIYLIHEIWHIIRIIYCSFYKMFPLLRQFNPSKTWSKSLWKKMNDFFIKSGGTWWWQDWPYVVQFVSYKFYYKLSNCFVLFCYNCLIIVIYFIIFYCALWKVFLEVAVFNKRLDKFTSWSKISIRFVIRKFTKARSIHCRLN